MGFITSNVPSTQKLNTKEKRKLFDEALIDVGLMETEDAEGNIMKNIQRLALSTWDSALYSENPKDRALFAKLIYERTGGKPKVITEEEHDEIPEIILRVNPKSAEEIKLLSERDDVSEDDSEDRVIVEVEGEAGRLEL